MISLTEARERGVCRICGKHAHAPLVEVYEGFPFKPIPEYAHEECFEREEEWREQSVAAIRQKLQYGIPPLSDEECCLLYELATGETIVRRKRCQRWAM